jgi:hypothetical protein
VRGDPYRERVLSTEPARRCNGFGFAVGLLLGSAFWLAVGGIYFLWFA